MAGLFASLAIRKALDTLSSFLPASLWAPSSSMAPRVRQGQDQDLENLRMLENTMRRIHATLHDAEQHWDIREESTKLRLKELKELAYDAEDVVEEYEYEVNRCRLQQLKENKGFPIDAGMVPVPTALAFQTRRLLERFDQLVEYHSNFTLSVNDGVRLHDISNISTHRETSSVVFAPRILGRENEKNTIIEKLFRGEGDSVISPISVLAIVGMGGVGKTTLAQLVYNDSMVRESFDIHGWVCVSENFDVRKITQGIISSLKMEKCDLLSVDILQKKLEDAITGKKVLLVLDDVWNDQRECWEMLCTPMMKTKLCKIIVTTRSERVARLVQTNPNFYNLNCLNFDESWLLFKQVAFTVDQENGPSHLADIGRAIVQKCKGLPLVIKTLGRMLSRETNEQGWRDALESKFWELEHPRNEVLPSLQLSYTHMPIYLKRCFVALSLYPKDYVFDIAEVLQLWKVLDLLRSDRYHNQDETGSRYLDELVERSFLEDGYFKNFSEDGAYVMHDLLHDLACFLSEDEFFTIGSDTTSIDIPQNVRYLSIQDGASGEISVAPLSLRAIIVLYDARVNIKNPEALFSNCGRLRALVLGERWLGLEFPALEARLKLLRHLKFVRLGACQLYWPGSQPDDGLQGIEHLVNLHTLIIYNYGIAKFPCWLGKASFVKLTEIELSGCDIEHLPTLGSLPFLVSLHFHAMWHLERIGREFCSHDPDVNGFPSLTKLTFIDMPKWLEWSGVGDGDFPRLHTLEIRIATHLRSLPPLMCLKTLVLDLCPCITIPALPKLRILHIRGYSSDDVVLNRLPSLEFLRIIRHCTQRIRLEPKHLASLRKLHLSCNNLQYCDGLGGLTSLVELKLWGCPKLPVHSLLPRMQLELIVREEEAHYFTDFDD